VQCNATGQVVLKLKTPWRDGTTHPVVPALKFMQRLAALVRRARLAPAVGPFLAAEGQLSGAESGDL
jgi:hypothetical protein